ncbi:hypothetical protein PAT3040_01253 [Paenibacillus agaridevorans]|uniref:Type II secretion system protein GspF domain-containing protein n=1 Tax=Paenibacillus agaridevorans TaxID=171404 RepID=A0A2R5EJB7_9BACL|nr:type II secretion system protein [Paenibacillus agaridevorans]GBG06720.1 hypothetical protein PAT3040_01253 [Paenibacillus agaridevorans]
MLAASATGMVAIWLYLIGTAAIKELLRAIRMRRNPSGGWQEVLLARPFLRVLAEAERLEVASLRVETLHRQLIVLKGASWSVEQTRSAAAQSLGQAYGALTASLILAGFTGEPVMSMMGAVVAIVLVLRRFVEADREVERRRRAIIAALPDMLAKLTLLVGAGETVQGAFAKCLDGGPGYGDSPLHKEWRHAVLSLQNGQSFGIAIERLGRSCGVQEVAIFTTVILLNYRRGGDRFVLALKEFSYSLWEKRKAAARTSGEEASSKLVFPLVGILFIMMVVVAAPAFLLMS